MALSSRSSWYDLDLGIKCDEADLADGDVVIVGGICDRPGTIREVWVGTDVLPTTGTLAVAKSAATDVNVLSAATVNLASGLTVHVAAKQTIATANTSVRVAAGDMLIATWTLTNITVTDDSVFCCKVLIEPDTW